MEPVVVVLIIFGSTGAILWKFFDSRHKERMAMIDKGVHAGDLKTEPFRWRLSPLTNLKWGMLAAFIGLGILAGNYLYEVMRWDDSVYPAMMFLFGGASLIIFYFIAARKENN